jgi:hypothetical protein
VQEGGPVADDIEDRVERLESGQGRILAKLDELLGGGKPAPAAAEPGDTTTGRPSTIEEQVRAELARKDAEARAAADKDAEQSERQTIRDQIAKLTEAKPVVPQPKRQRVMWGPR